MKDCYGRMFPDLSRLEYNKVMEGMVFKVQVGCTGIVPQSRQVEYDLSQWEACRRCEHFRDCFDLSKSMFMIERAIAAIR